MEVALKIDWDISTGERAGGIDPRDPGLYCCGWQDMEKTPAVEIKVITDERDVDQYRGKPGVKVLEGRGKIEEAIAENIPVKYEISDSYVCVEAMKEAGMKLSVLWEKTGKTVESLYRKKIAGITMRKPQPLPRKRQFEPVPKEKKPKKKEARIR